jgi:hypothetical protein
VRQLNGHAKAGTFCRDDFIFFLFTEFRIDSHNGSLKKYLIKNYRSAFWSGVDGDGDADVFLSIYS